MVAASEKPPTPADFFSFREDPGTSDGRAQVIRDVCDMMKKHGALFFRTSLIRPGDASGYPPGLWFEGWRDRHPNQLPFGTAAKEGGPIYPPLTVGKPA